MKLKDYAEIHERAKAVGLGDDDSLDQLLHLLQAKEVAKKHFRGYMREMHEWEKNVARFAVERIEEAERSLKEVER